MISQPSIYSGYVRFNEQLYKGDHAPVVEESLFRKVQTVRRDRSHGSTKLKRVFFAQGFDSLLCVRLLDDPALHAKEK